MNKNRRIIVAIYLIYIVLPNYLYSKKLCQQDKYEVISGIIVDSQSKNALNGINVYLSGTTIGTTTNSKGEYSLKIKGNATYDLVISSVGYETKIIRIDFNMPHPSVYNIELNNISYQLNSITVAAQNDTQWRNQFEYFKTLFLGKREFASECKFINGYFLDFIENNVVLIANTKVPIQIINQDLGYDIKVVFDSFEYNKVNHTLEYKVYPQFNELTTQNKDSLNIYVSNRKDAYHGSLMELLSLLSEGGSEFEVYGYEIFYMSGKRIFANVLSADEIVVRAKDTELYYLSPVNGSMLRFGFKCRGLKINYSGADKEETSYIISLKEDGIEFNPESGSFLFPSEYVIKGKWSEYGFADQLPTNYYRK